MTDKNPAGRAFQMMRPVTWPVGLRWAALLLVSAVFVFLLELVHLPAALLLGPMATAVLMATLGGGVRIGSRSFTAAQGIVGMMIASNMPPSLFSELQSDWPIFVVGVFSTVAAAAFLGWLMARTKLFPGTTAIWGSSPGAAAAMTLMSAGYGADMRLVAFMQYVRVVCVVLAATVVARFMGVTVVEEQSILWFPAVDWLAFAATVAAALLAGWIGMRLKLPGGALLLPLAVGMAIKFSGVMPIVLPPWILALSFAVIGWGIGMRFTRDVVAHAARALPRVLLSVFSLIAICGCFAAGLVYFAGIDPLSAYLATSPGGADSVAIIAASTNVDVPFVMAMQVTRFIFVVITGPATARLLSRSTKTDG
ncbi:AbrB family transcriptional regulator [Rhizobium panacihumi]|uniref:AbrB family transcriptional regulator n=1 Tax=Rhizobium panacihumi TaxID=2008450 RepID=UPI003D7B2EBF